jgi:hypothetical protein
MKTEELETMWSNIEVVSVHIAILVAAHYNKLVAEGIEGDDALELTKVFADVICKRLFPTINA